MVIVECMDKFLEHDEYYPFAAYAFGPHYYSMKNTMDLMVAWNELHADKLRLTPNGNIMSDMEKMVEIWKTQTMNQQQIPHQTPTT